MPIEKTTFITTASGDRIVFRPEGEQLRAEIVSHDSGEVSDFAMLGRDDLVTLLGDFFPQQRKPRERSIAAPTNGSGRRLGRGLPRVADPPLA